MTTYYEKVKIFLMRMLFIFFSLYILCTSPVRADQCEWVFWDVAEKAYKLLKHSKDYTEFCAPCMDKEPITLQINTLDIQLVHQKDTDDRLYQILVNGKSIDIAYVYINGKNLGMQANCSPISGVPEYIDDFFTGRRHPEETLL